MLSFMKSTVLALVSGLFVLQLGGIAGAQLQSLDKICADNPAASVCEEINQVDSSDNPITGDSGVVPRVVDILSLAVAVISVIIIIVAGITMTVSSGDAGKVKSSRDAIIYAVVGIVVVALARPIIIFVVNRI